jgi:hypothetical protein
MNTSLELVVVAIILLVTALVILTIFGNSLIPVTDFASARSICYQSGASSCVLTGQLPGTWNSQNIRYKDTNGDTKTTSCATLTGCSGTCKTSCNFATPAA